MFISAKECRIEKNRSFYGCFCLGAFDSGQSITVANALRRSLLSDCTGLAIISVKIENVYHEYSTLPGVRDSVLDILLNFKEIILKKLRNPLKGSNGYKKKGLSSVYEQVGSTFFKPLMGYLKVKGPGVIRAKDLRLPSFIQCVDPNQYIATLAEDGFLNLKFVIMEGKNYYIAPQVREAQKGPPPVFEENEEGALSRGNDVFARKEKKLIDRENSTKAQPNKNFKFSPKREISESEHLEDNSHFWERTKKRENLLKQLKQILEVSATKGDSIGLEPLNQLENKKSLSNFWQNGKKKTIKSKSNFIPSEGSSVDVLHEKSKQLNIDAVFNPVTKVNYIIEGYENYIVESYNSKVKGIENLTSFLDSSLFLQTNYPFLLSQTSGVEDSLFSPEVPATEKAVPCFSTKNTAVSNKNVRFCLTGTETSSTRTLLDSLIEGSNIPTSTLMSLCTSEGYSHYKGIGIPSSYPKLKVPSTLPKNFANLDTCVNISSKQIIFLEIWTNGSLHPREALSMAFKNLSYIFNADTLKISNPIFRNTSSYKKKIENI